MPSRVSKTTAVLLTGALLLAGSILWALFQKKVPAVSEVELADLESRDGRLFKKESKLPFSGRVLSHDSSGVLRSSAGVQDGVLHGLSEGWFTNGVLQVRERFVHGVSNGSRTKWREDGSVVSETAIVQGLIEGRFSRWHTNGVLAEEAFFKKGVPTGEARMWHADGTLASWCRLEDGKVADSRRWEPGECREWPATVAKAP
jgi:antitoxin component YwqK of YwqJK toxin-antitoxin module